MGPFYRSKAGVVTSESLGLYLLYIYAFEHCFGRFTTQVGDDQYYEGIPYNTLTTQWCFGRFTTQVREDMYFWKMHD